MHRCSPDLALGSNTQSDTSSIHSESDAAFVRCRHLEAAQLLLAAGANPTPVHAESGSTPLHRAAWKGYGPIVQLLLDNGANVEVAETADDGQGKTALHLAADAGHTHVASQLLAAGASVVAIATRFYGAAAASSPLHLAAAKGRARTAGEACFLPD
jgi:ankyrin repeat protein